MNTLLWYTLQDVSVHCSAKCGSQTLLKAILKHHGIEDPGFGKRRATVHYELVKPGLVEATDKPETFHRIQFVRDPMDRFESLWRWGCRDKNQGIPASLWGDSPDELLWYIDYHLYENPHWCPQFVATPYSTKLLPLSALNDFLGVEAQQNRTGGEVPAYDTGLLKELYMLDYMLFAQAEKSPL